MFDILDERVFVWLSAFSNLSRGIIEALVFVIYLPKGDYPNSFAISPFGSRR